MVTFAPAAAEMRLLTPPMQAEVDAIVFDKQPQRKPVLKHETTAPDFVMARSGVMGAEGKDTESHFKGGSMEYKRGLTQQALPFDAAYSTAHADEDTRSHFQNGFLSDEAQSGAGGVWLDGSKGAAQHVYPQAHRDMDTFDHFEAPGSNGRRWKPPSPPHQPMRPPGPSEGPGRAYAPRSTASAAWRLAVVASAAPPQPYHPP